jgi:hypothetical protein
MPSNRRALVGQKCVRRHVVMRNAFITVMQAAQLRDLNDPADTRDQPRNRTLLVEAQNESSIRFRIPRKGSLPEWAETPRGLGERTDSLPLHFVVTSDNIK